MGDGTCDEGDRRVRVKHNAISDKVSRPWRVLGKSHVVDM